jgi:hypothetical protein
MTNNVQQKLLNFQLEKTSDILTSKSGLSLFYEAARCFGIPECLNFNLPSPGSNRGLKPAEYVMPLVLMFCGGGRTLEDIREIERDKGLRKLCGFSKIPSPDAIGQWIRKENHLIGLKKVNEFLAEQIICKSGRNNFTLDTDATLIETEKDCAKMTYKGFRAFSSLISFISDLDLCLANDYRNGNEHAGTGVEEQIIYSDELLKKNGKKLKYFRSDSAGYKAEVINICEERGIIFTITADQDSAVKSLIGKASRNSWRVLYDEEDHYTGREYTTAIHTMNQTKKAFTLIVQRWINPQMDLFQPDDYCYYVIATSDYDKKPEEIIRFQNRRGNSENYNKELKNGFGMDSPPSRELKANAVYSEMEVLAYNLAIAVKRLFLGGDWVTKTIATLRWQLIFVAGKIVEHGRKLFLKISDCYFELFNDLRQKIYLFSTV